MQPSPYKNQTAFHLSYFQSYKLTIMSIIILFILRNGRIGYLLNRCTEKLHTLHLIGVAHDLSAVVQLNIRNFHWEMMAVPSSPYDEELKHFHLFLSKCSKLERLSLVGKRYCCRVDYFTGF